jgi:hypothetical protein
MGLFMVGVLKKWKWTPRLLWDYFLQITITWNKFKWKILSSAIQDNSCDVGEFSHLYIIACEYFCL